MGLKVLKMRGERQTVRKLRVPLQVHQLGNRGAKDVSVQQTNRLRLRWRQRQSGWWTASTRHFSLLNVSLSSPDHWPLIQEPNSLQTRRRKTPSQYRSHSFDGLRDAFKNPQFVTKMTVFIPSNKRTCSGWLSNTTFTRGHNYDLFDPCDGLLLGKTSGHVLFLPLLQRFAVHRPLQHKWVKFPVQVGANQRFKLWHYIVSFDKQRSNKEYVVKMPQ